jgi:hypothetical protein
MKKRNKSQKQKTIFIIHFLILILVFIASCFVFKNIWRIDTGNKQTSKNNQNNDFYQKPEGIYDYEFTHNLNYFNQKNNWTTYKLKIFYGLLGQNNYREYGYFKLKLPLEVQTEEKFIYEPDNTLLVKKDKSTLYIGEQKIFSTSGTFFCIDCQKIGSFRTQILGKKINFPIIEEMHSGQVTYIGKISLGYGSYDLSIRAESLSDFYLFLQIAETLEYSES